MSQKFACQLRIGPNFLEKQLIRPGKRLLLASLERAKFGDVELVSQHSLGSIHILRFNIAGHIIAIAVLSGVLCHAINIR